MQPLATSVRESSSYLERTVEDPHPAIADLGASGLNQSARGPASS